MPDSDCAFGGVVIVIGGEVLAREGCIKRKARWKMQPARRGSSFCELVFGRAIHWTRMRLRSQARHLAAQQAISSRGIEDVSIKGRKLILAQYEKKLADYNFGTMVRKDADRPYDHDNCILVTRVQFFAIEVRAVSLSALPLWRILDYSSLDPRDPISQRKAGPGYTYPRNRIGQKRTVGGCKEAEGIRTHR